MRLVGLSEARHLSWLKLVHTSDAAGDGFGGLGEVAGEGPAAVMVCRPAWISIVR